MTQYRIAMKKTIKLMADYQCYPLWWDEPELVGNIDPAKLPLSQETLDRLSNWTSAYDATLNQDYPPDSGFGSEEDAQAFEQEGISLWQQLQKELAPDYEVLYFSEQQRQLLAHPSQLTSVRVKRVWLLVIRRNRSFSQRYNYGFSLSRTQVN